MILSESLLVGLNREAVLHCNIPVGRVTIPASQLQIQGHPKQLHPHFFSSYHPIGETAVLENYFVYATKQNNQVGLNYMLLKHLQAIRTKNKHRECLGRAVNDTMSSKTVTDSLNPGLSDSKCRRGA
jgi:hypothetical protein